MNKTKHKAPGKKWEALRKIVYQIPEEVDPAAYNAVVDQFFSREKDHCLKAGECAPYLYDFKLDRIIHVGDGIRHILGISPEEVEKNNITALFSECIFEEHVFSVVRFSGIFYEFIRKKTRDELSITLDINMVTRQKELKRILFQFRPALYDNAGTPVLTRGLITDITPIKKYGLPQLILMRNGRFHQVVSGTPEDLLEAQALPLTLRETEILSLRSKGKQVKEIAQLLKLQESTIFSYFRDIRKKTKMDIIPLIKLLTDKGIIS